MVRLHVFLPMLLKSVSGEDLKYGSSKSDWNESLNPGRPLDKADLFRVRQLVMPLTTDRMRLPPKVRRKRNTMKEPNLEKLEVIGEQTAKKLNKKKQNVVEGRSFRWPHGIVPYTIDAAFSRSEKAIIASGFEQIQRNSCVRFIAQTTEVDYLDIVPGKGGCYTLIPYRTGLGRLEVGLQQSGCVTQRAVLRQLLQVLGLRHEHTRPDRDEHVTVNWANIRNEAASQLFKDEWEGVTAILPRCTISGLPGGQDYSRCYSGWLTDACDKPYDLASIMHHDLASSGFAIDPSRNVMAPKNKTVTSAGNSVLSPLDIEKLQCLYNCNGSRPGTCGGNHHRGDRGELESRGNKTCEWQLLVGDGYGIRLTIPSFRIACAAGDLRIYDGPDSRGREHRYCGRGKPGLAISSDSSLYVVYTSNSSSSIFRGGWQKFEIVCCDSVELSSSNTDFVNSAYRNLLLGNWTKEGEEVNNRPVYRRGNYFLAVASSNSSGLRPNWVVTSRPGSQSGFMFEKSFPAPKCPHAVHKWRYFSQNLFRTEDDDSLAVTCGARCSDEPPQRPPGASYDHDDGNSTLAGSVVTYSCGQGHKVYASCNYDGQWSPGIVSCNVGWTTSTPLPCTWRLKGGSKLRGKLIGKPSKSKSARDCLNKCKNKRNCKGMNWRNTEKEKRQCFLLESISKKTKETNNTVAGWCML